MENPALRDSIVSHYTTMVKACWYYAGPRRWRMVLFYTLCGFANLAMMLQPWVIGKVINTLQLGGDNLVLNTALWLGSYAALMIAFWLFHGPSRVIELMLACRIRQAFYQEIYHRLTVLPLHWHYNNHSGNLMNRINKAGSSLYKFAGLQFDYLETMFRYVILLVLVAIISWPVALALFLFSILVSIMMLRFDRSIMREVHLVNEKEHIFTGRLFDYINNIASVIAFTRRNTTKADLISVQKAIYPHQRKDIYLNEIKWLLWMVLAAFMYFGVLFGYIYWHLETGTTLLLGSVVTIF